jgi:hypothetical protein
VVVKLMVVALVVLGKMISVVPDKTDFSDFTGFISK